MERGIKQVQAGESRAARKGEEISGFQEARRLAERYKLDYCPQWLAKVANMWR